MGHKIDLNKYNIRTDLIIESIENGSNNINTKREVFDDISVVSVDIDDDSSKLLEKKKGRYVTILFDDATDSEACDKLSNVFVNVLKDFVKDSDNILVVGLGNDESTPDSLGPKVMDNLIITRHLFLLGEDVSDNVRKVSGICPGVMANTGIETSNYIKAIVEDVAPSLVIVIDALASSSMARVNKSIQITDTGIEPGSGVGNMRKEISFDTLGVPVVAIGVPTVVESSVIVYDTINYLFKHISYIRNNQSINKLVFTRSNYLKKINDSDLDIKDKKEILGLIGELSDMDKKSLIDEVLTSVNYNFIVTPKEIDFVIDKLADIIGNGLNRYLHNI